MDIRVSSRSTAANPIGPGIPWVPLAGASREAEGFVRRDFAEAFERAGLRQLDDFFKVEGESLSKPGLGTRYRARLRLRLGREPAEVYLKRFGGEPFRERLRRRFEHGRWRTAGEHEMRVCEALRKEGIAVPEPLAWGRGRQSDGTLRSVVVLSAVPGESCVSWARSEASAPPAVKWRRMKKLTKSIAEVARRFHAHGWRHRDFYLCHLFVAETQAGLSVSLIDLQRAFQPCCRRERWQVKDLAQLNFSAQAERFSRTMRLRFAHWYFGVNKLGPQHRCLLRRVLRKSRSIARRSRS